MKYGLYVTQGQGSSEVPDLEFDTLDEALAHVEEHAGEASFGIKYPDGDWYQWTYEDQLRSSEAMARKNPPHGYRYENGHYVEKQ
jgi:hypothetical protein